jgi:uncharacterized protein
MWIVRLLIEGLLELLIISPLYVRFLRQPGDRRNARLFLLFAVFSLLHDLLLRLPMHYMAINFAPGNWNWSGKVYSIIGSIIFYRLFRHEFADNDFVTFRQQPGSLRPVLLVMGLVLLAMVIGIGSNERATFDAETLFYQFTMPGFDEEPAYRGVMLGLLVTVLRPQIRLGRFRLGHPGIWITAMLFGLGHGFSVNDDWQIQFDWLTTFFTGAFGWVVGWLALRSRSILFPTVLHNLSNGLGSLLQMLK